MSAVRTEDWLGWGRQVGRVLAPSEAHRNRFQPSEIPSKPTLPDVCSPAGLARWLGWSVQHLDEPSTEEALRFPDLDACIQPTKVYRDESGDALVFLFWCDDDFDQVPLGASWKVSHQHRVDRFLQQQPGHLGILFNQKDLRLCYSPPAEMPGFLAFSLRGDSVGERLAVLRSLLGSERLVAGPDGTSLAQMLQESKSEWAELTTELGQGAIQALSLLLEGVTVACATCENVSLESFTEAEVYDSLTTLLLRMLIVLCAEEKGLFPIDNATYQKRYSLSHLAECLERDFSGERVGGSRRNAFSRLLHTSDVVCQGISTSELRMRAYGGEVFDTRRLPLLLSLDKENCWPSDACIHRVFQKLRYVDGQRFSYQALHGEQLGTVYEQLLDVAIESTSTGWAVVEVAERKSTGTHYTPRVLCDFIVQHCIAEVLPPSPTPEEILQLNLCDPAMGSGAFLASACRHLGTMLVDAWARAGENPTLVGDVRHFARQQVAKHCLYGVDLNPKAVQLAQISLWIETAAVDQSFAFLAQALKTGNSLVGASPDHMRSFSFSMEEQLSTQAKKMGPTESVEQMLNIGNLFVATAQDSYGFGVHDRPLGKRARQRLFTDRRAEVQRHLNGSPLSDVSIDRIKDLDVQPVHWQSFFPAVFAQKNGFDIVVGNPPFVNCIRGDIDPFVKQFIKDRFPIITGSADLSYYFLQLSTELIRPKGSIGLVLPRVSMGASALSAFRQSQNHPKPVVMYSANHHRFFAGAAIKVVAYIFGEASDCLVSNCDNPLQAKWQSVPMGYADWWPSFRGNWWAKFSLGCLNEQLPPLGEHQRLLESGFEVYAGLTTGEFYKIAVAEEKSGTGLKLITSGGIDPNESFWGQRNNLMTFRKTRYQFPRIQNEDYSEGLQAKLKRSQRPKIIVANLTKKVEAFFDARGEYQASTATQTIYHKEDDPEKLARLCALLHSSFSNRLFVHILGYNAMHSNISMEKSFLENFPIPLAED